MNKLHQVVAMNSTQFAQLSSFSLQITIRDKFEKWNALVAALTTVSAYRSFEGNRTHLIKWVIWSKNDKAHTCLFKSTMTQIVPELCLHDNDLELDRIMRKFTRAVIGQINPKFRVLYTLSPIGN